MSILRVGIDGRAFSSPAAGVRRYVKNLVTALLALDDGLDIVALGGTTPAVLPRGVGHIPEPAHPPTNLGWMLAGLPRAAVLGGVDVIHAPAYTAPLLTRTPTVLTIHDVSYARHPEWYPYKQDWVRRAFYRRSARKATRILTDSAFSASEITAAYGIDPARIRVAPLGVEPLFAPAPVPGSCDLPSGIIAPFLLHVGDLHERRNLVVLLDAVLDARRHFGALPSLSLVLAGVDRGVGSALCAIAAEAGAPEAVIQVGPVDDDLLLTLYRCATALVYPSLYEGFGLPVLEAMACGLPVIGSSAASIPEVLGDAGVLLDPNDVHAWSAAIVQVVNDEGARNRMRAAGLARAQQFTWAETARRTLDVYRAAAA